MKTKTCKVSHKILPVRYLGYSVVVKRLPPPITYG